jgi:lysophospholipase L1-like esterase
MKKLIATFILLILFAACEPKNDTNIEDAYTIGPTAVVIGDSLTNSGRTQLHYQLGVHFSSKIAAIPGATYGGMTGYAEDYMMEGPTVAVIALGTNDRNTQWVLDDSLLSLNTMYDMYEGMSCTVGVTITTDDVKPELNAKAIALNENMRARADAVADWDAIDREPGMTQADGVHATAEGYAKRAEIIGDAVESCGENPHVPPTTTTTTLIPEGP